MIRVEKEDDFRQVEEMVRDAFWNLYMPGPDEHFIVQRMRNKHEFIKELSLVYIDSSSSQNRQLEEKKFFLKKKFLGHVTKLCEKICNRILLCIFHHNFIT